MKPSKTENEVESTMKSTTKYAFVPPGAIRKGQGRGRGLRSLVEKKNMPIKSLFPQSSDLVKQYIQTIETSAIGKGRGQGLKSSTMSASQGTGMIHKNSIVLEKEYMQIDIPLPPSTDQVKQYTQKVEASSIGKGREQTPRSLCSSSGISKSTRSNFTMSSNQEMRTMDKNSLVLEKEHMQTNISLPPSTNQVMQHSQATETAVGSSSNPGKVKRVRGRNKCKEVASLEVVQKLKVTFYNNRTVGTNRKLFSRHLGRIVRDRNMCPLGVSSWNDIKEEKLNHMWAAIEDKFESVDMNDHREHIFGWMKELWNKWRGHLHAKYVKDKPIQHALKNIPNGVDKKEWERLVKEHFCSESFQIYMMADKNSRLSFTCLSYRIMCCDV
ncbi:PREDICTED: uncharacterized protein LOC109220825 [Nicotiana attenuata]|uniref:uncharacterized protein LOC109220825 n=1 Tax=Nicotiana attenuata TaxID=49451 RepID=UPI0009048BFE|nr:PREDICTED: uncharacterized protein LOC109220825 [Nicotiana attenuata]